MSSSAADSSKTSFEGFSKSKKLVAERDLYPHLRAVIGAVIIVHRPDSTLEA